MRVAAASFEHLRSQLLVPAALLMALLSPSEVRACIDLPDAEIRQLDYLRMKDPSDAERIARTKLAQGDELSAEKRVQYHLIVAFAAGNEGRGKDARAALDAALTDLKNVPAGAPARALLSRSIAEGEFGAADTRAEYLDGLARIKQAVRTADPGTAEGACLLLTRGLFEIALDQLDLGVVDQIEAYRTARAHHWERAAALASMGLTAIYVRSGMYVEAGQMNEEMIRYATANGFTHWLITAVGRSGDILAGQRRWLEAIAAFEKSQRMAAEQGDEQGAAELRLPICDALIDGGQEAAAEQRCRGDAALFDRMRRPDLAAVSRFNDARIARWHGRYAESLRLMDGVIDGHLKDVPLRLHPELYRQRAASAAALGHFADAYRDLAASMTAANSLAQSDKIRTVAVLTGRAKARELEDANRQLAADNLLQRSIAERHRANLRLGVGLAIAGLLVSGLLAILFIRESRHRRALGRQARVLRTLTDNLADSVMLLDGTNRVMFANRAPASGADAIEGRPLGDVVPDESRQQFLAAIADASAGRQTIDFDVKWPTAGGAVRYLEQRVSPVLEGSAVIGLTMRSADVTEKRAVERVLKMHARVLETMQEGVVVVDASRHIVFANNAMCSALGYASGALTGLRIDDLSADLGHVPDGLDGLTPDARTQLEAVVRARDGAERLMAITCSALDTEDDVAAVCVCHDITTQRLIERALAVAETREAENVGVTLHEGLAQDLAGIAMLTAAERRVPDSAGGQRDDSSLSEYLAEAIARARKLGGRISPLAAARGSLPAALTALARAAEASSGASVRCTFDPPAIAISRVVGDQVYRLVDDMMGYVTERYRYDSASLAVVCRDTKLVLTLEWTGSERATRSREVGWLARGIIAYRSKLLGGRCEFREGTEQPDTIIVSIALDHASPPQDAPFVTQR